MWGVKMFFFFFSVEWIKKGREKPDGLKTCPVNTYKDSINNESVTLDDEVSRNCSKLALRRMQF